VTLTGVGGVGKTRLALHVAGDILHTFPDGAWLVELAPLGDPRFIAQAVASVLGIREVAGGLLLTTLGAALREKHLLLILDNCEHLLAGCADLADALLRACPRLHILATSREPLGLLGEQLYPIQPLAAPGTRQAYTIEDLACMEAVSLFCERARTCVPTIRLTVENVSAVAELCRRLDGLPLAIELAAAHIRLRSPQALLEHSPLATLVGGPRNLPSRQQTLRNTIDWSYQLLDSHEQQLFNCMGIFVGGWTTEAAEAICGATGDPAPAVAAGLDALL
jgi:serine/threonine-protein kinase PknK